jgi:hypothetical protein
VFPERTWSKSRFAMRSYNLSAFVLAVWGFLFSSAVAGQIIFHAQGDTPAITFRYGLLYVLYAGVPGAFRGEYLFIISLTCQLIAGALFFWVGRKYPRTAWIAAALLTLAACLWLVVIGPKLFV